MNVFETVLNAKWHVLGADILYREIVGNVFGLASAVGGMRRRIWAWPVGIVGNVLLFTVFLGGVFHTPQDQDLYGQAGRQVMFAIVSVYGWWQWNRARQRPLTANDAEGAPVTPPVRPHWAGGAAGPRSWSSARPARRCSRGCSGSSAHYSGTRLADAWIFTGSFLATYGMARGWNEFWLIWIGVDAVGVPLLFNSHLYPSAVLYCVYAMLVIWGFVVWLRTQRRDEAEAAAAAAARPVVGARAD